MEFQGSNYLSPSLGHIEEPFLVRPTGMESPPDLFFVWLRVLGLMGRLVFGVTGHILARTAVKATIFRVVHGVFGSR